MGKASAPGKAKAAAGDKRKAEQPKPPAPEPEEEGLPLYVRVDSSVRQGRREKQEDCHVMIKDLHKVGVALKMPLTHLPKPAMLLGVYDGHQLCFF